MNEKSLDNLKKGKATQFRSGDVAAKICGSKGGTSKSNKVKFRNLVEKMAEQEVPASVKKEIFKKGFTVSDNAETIAAEVVIGARNGDPEMIKLYMSITGQDIRHEELDLKKRELKLKEKAAAENNSAAALDKISEAIQKIVGDE